VWLNIPVLIACCCEGYVCVGRCAVTYCRHEDWYIVWLRYGNEGKSLGTFLHSAAMGILGRKCGTGVNVRRVCESYIVFYHMLSHLHL